MSAIGPRLPSSASAGYGSYPGISCRQWGPRTTAGSDPKLSWPRFAVVLHLVQWGFGVVAPLQNNGPNAVEVFNARDRIGVEQHHIGILSFLDRSHAGRAA